MNSDEILRDVLLATIKEQRAKRRWSIFFRLIILGIIAGIIYNNYFSSALKKLPVSSPSHVGVVNISGVISSDSPANASAIISGLDSAFNNKNSKGVILKINSPGGSPVEASDVYNEIFRLRDKYPQTKIYAVCTDMCTSAAYYIASATNDIYANKASLVGSIGVLIDGFGFVDTMQKVGIQRRLMISGDHKAFLDPFSPVNLSDQQAAQAMIDGIHQQFIADVEKGRGTRLKINADTFSGMPWTGAQALPLGIIDGYGSTREVARNIIKENKLINYTQKKDIFSKLADRFGASLSVHIGELLGLSTGKGIREETNF